MKKAFFTLIAILYLGMSSGIAMDIHYCMGKLAGIELFGGEKDKCGKCGMKEKKGGCCNDEHHFVKISDSHKNVTNNIDFSFATPAILTSYTNFNNGVPQLTFIHQSFSSSPPGNISPRRCILFCVFRL